ncbi:rhodanese-like domain-containing protein [Desulfovibrio subterraneus]|uniref:Sulfurtransferase n=1 Tax=Desulfovibrio subterraneus TaxID=2718620 RepID=A0A7J0BHF2_9BACT|nr:rhodanese-like domain-containing protein [Desulfovibrio subterraneus]GFM32998.1 sulfurtransferase [Desulfovibrio subterraneus]
MRWRQFLTPVRSVDAHEARTMLDADPQIQLLDVRQEKEYQEEHIAGAKFIPLASLDDMLGEIDKERPVLVYCAIGGRSRVAAQLLAGKGFEKVLNLSGGIKAWNGWKGFGDYEQGLDLFMNAENLQEVLEVAYVMEKALGDFYMDMASRVSSPKVANLFSKLASVEDKHSKTVAERLQAVTGNAPLPEVGPDAAPEGGLSTAEYMHRLGTDTESPRDVVDFAMALEAQAMDLYARAAENAPDDSSREALERMALEERGHLKHLAVLMDSLV